MTVARSTSLLVALVVAATLVACGGGSESSATSTTDGDAAGLPPGAPASEQTVEEFAQVLEGAIADAGSGDCQPFYDLFYPGGPAVDESVFPCEQLGRAAKGFEVTGTAEYGTGAVVDTHDDSTSPQDGDPATPADQAFVLARADNGFFYVLAPPLPADEETVGTEAADTTPFTDVVEAGVQAAKDQDCKAYFKYWYTGGASERQYCADYQPGPLAQAAAEVEGDPHPMGGNDHVQLYWYETPDGFATIADGRSRASDQPLIGGIAPVQTAG